MLLIHAGINDEGEKDSAVAEEQSLESGAVVIGKSGLGLPPVTVIRWWAVREGAWTGHGVVMYVMIHEVMDHSFSDRLDDFLWQLKRGVLLSCLVGVCFHDA